EDAKAIQKCRRAQLPEPQCDEWRPGNESDGKHRIEKRQPPLRAVRIAELGGPLKEERHRQAAGESLDETAEKQASREAGEADAHADEGQAEERLVYGVRQARPPERRQERDGKLANDEATEIQPECERRRFRNGLVKDGDEAARKDAVKERLEIENE